MESKTEEKDICAWCRLYRTGGDVTFASQPKYLENVDPDEIIGGIRQTDWFCYEHYPLAHSMEHLSPEEAWDEMRRTWGNTFTNEAIDPPLVFPQEPPPLTWWQRLSRWFGKS